MIDQGIFYFLQFLQGMPSEIASLFTFLVCIVAIMGACRFGAIGLCAYNTIAIVFGNIQVLRLGTYFSTPEPVALGTVLFATTFLVSDIITENYGPKLARQCIVMSFTAQLVVTAWMILCLGHAGVENPEQLKIYDSFNSIFIPQARFFIASLISYVLSQLVDISLYQWIRKKSKERYLWLRQNVSTFVSGLFDNLCFSILAWIVLNPEPLSLKTVIIVYVFAGYLMRFFVSVLGTPILYYSKNIIQGNPSVDFLRKNS